MLLSSCSPDAQSYCPVCKKLIKCYMKGGNLAFPPRYLKLYHDECGTTWIYHMDEKRHEIIKNGS